MNDALAVDSLREDSSYPSSVMQLRFRMEDLYVRLILAREGRALRVLNPSIRFSDEELRYVPCEHLYREEDVLRALGLCIAELSIPQQLEAPEEVLPEQLVPPSAP